MFLSSELADFVIIALFELLHHKEHDLGPCSLGDLHEYAVQ